MRRLKRGILRNKIERRKQEIVDTLPTKRPPKILDARTWAQAELGRIDTHLDGVRASLGSSEDEQEAREAGEQASNLRGFALTEFLIDMPAQAALSMAAFSGLSIIENAAIGTALGTAITYSALGVLRLWEDPSMPARSLRVARWIGGTLFAVAAAGGLFFLSARFLLPDLYLKVEQAVFISLAVAAEALAISAGAVVFGARVAERPFRTIRESEALEERKAMIDDFVTWLNGQEPPPSGGEAETDLPHLVPGVSNA